MRKKILSVSFLMVSATLLAQVGIGTLKPNPVSLLDVKVENKDYKGVLLPRIPLESNTDTTTIGVTADSESLLVYNTTQNSTLQPGYYYWFDKQWVRLINSKDDIISSGVSNDRFAVNTKDQTLELIDTNGKTVSIALSEINIVSTLTAKEDGTYVYTDETGKQTLIDVPSDVINNISKILNDPTVLNEIKNIIDLNQEYIFNILASHGKKLSTDGRSLSISPLSNTALLSDVSIDVLDAGIAPIKIEPAEIDKSYLNGNYLLATHNGEVRWIKLVSDIIKGGLDIQEKVTLLIPDPQIEGKFTYYNEQSINKYGDINGPGVTINSNTLKIDNLNDVYVFNDGQSRYDGTPLAIIDVPGIVNNRIDTVLKSETVQNEIVNLVRENAKDATSRDSSITLSDPSKVFLKDLDITVSDKGITHAKLADSSVDTKNVIPYQDNAVLASVANTSTGELQVKWISEDNPIWKDILHKNETVTRLIDNKNGTFTYYNEQDSLDVNGQPIGGVVFNANTLTIEQKTDHVYEFYAMDSTTPLATIDIRASNIIFEDNTIKYDNVEQAITELINQINNLENQKQETGDLTGQGIIVGGDAKGIAAVLKDVELSVADGAITETKMSAGQGKENFVPVAQSDGTVKYQDVNSVIEGKGLTLSGSFLATGDLSKALLSEVYLSIENEGIQNEHIAPLSVSTDKISSTLKGEDALKNSVLIANGSGAASFVDPNTIIQTVVQGDLQGAIPGPISVNNGSNVLFGNGKTNTTIDIVDSGIKEKHIAIDAVTTDKLKAEAVTTGKIKDGAVTEQKLYAGEAPGTDVRIAVADEQGAVEYLPLSVDLLEAAKSIKGDGIIEVVDGENSVLKDVTLSINDTSITASKLTGGVGGDKRFAVSDGTGAVTYRTLKVDDLATGTITTDKIIEVSKADGVVLSDVTIWLKDESITNTQLATDAVTNEKIINNAVTAEKLSSAGIGDNMILSSVGGPTSSEVQWRPLTEILNFPGADLTGDGIIEVANGDGSVLKETQLNIKDKSITIDKLSSGLEDEKLIMQTDGNGGFVYTTVAALAKEGSKLTLQDALSLVDGNPEAALLTPLTIGVSDGGITTQKLADLGVTVAKINPESALENSVLSVTSTNTVEFKALNPAAFSEGGKNLVNTDGSISVAADNKALLSETSIEVAEKGIKTNHIDVNAVGTAQINSKSQTNTNVAKGDVLSSDGTGGTMYSSLQDIAALQGKGVTSDGSLTIPTGNKAALQELEIKVADAGIKTEHIADRAVLPKQISSVGDDVYPNYILVADDNGATKYVDPSSFLIATGKTAKGGTGISIPDGQDSVLKDIEISVSDGGVSTLQLADNAVTSEKLSDGSVTNSKLAANSVNTTNIINNAVTSDKLLDGSVTNSKLAVNSVGTDNIINLAVTQDKLADKAVVTAKLDDQAVTSDKLADLAVTTGKIADSAVKESKLADESVSTDKIVDLAVNGGKIADSAVSSIKIGAGEVKTTNLATSSVTSGKIADNAVTTTKIEDASVTTSKVANLAVTSAKINSENASSGFVLTADGQGKASFKAPSGVSQGSGDLAGDGVNGPIVVTDGAKSTFKDVTVSLQKASITHDYLGRWAVQTDNIDQGAVTTNELANGAVTTSKIADNNITTSKLVNNAVTGEKIAPITITEDKIKTTPATTGYVLTSDGVGGAKFLPASSQGGSNVFTKLFYMPPVYVDVVSGVSAELDLYGIYAGQFAKPMVSSTNSTNNLPVASKDNLNYHVLYYDTSVFSSVTVDQNGVMKYTIVNGAQATGRTFFSIVLELK